MQILNIAGYKFVSLNHLETLRSQFLELCQQLALKGTILLSHEGINITLAGYTEKLGDFKSFLKNDSRFSDITFRESYSDTQPFHSLKIKLKNEIITMRHSEIAPIETRAASISPKELKQWLDEKRDITLLDTRNDYEVRFGTFKNAINLHLNNFSEFPASVETMQKDKPIVMFCTGGIRCEKAALYMLSQGFSDIYQLEGGILDYFAKVGGDHYDGECFVFDDRISVDPHLAQTQTIQCSVCQGPVTQAEQQLPSYVPQVSCHACIQK